MLALYFNCGGVTHVMCLSQMKNKMIKLKIGFENKKQKTKNKSENKNKNVM